MYIKKILEYSYSYAEYIVSDGSNELRCVCASVPLPNDREPQCGMEITKIFAFCVNDIVIGKIIDKKEMRDSISKTKKKFLGYKIKGRVLDANFSIIEVFDFKISLEYFYPDGLDATYKNGDYIEFFVDRFDCVIENIYWKFKILIFLKAEWSSPLIRYGDGT